MDIYTELKAAGVPINNHESDLYCKVNKDSQRILQNYEHKKNVYTFINRVDGSLWYDIPFAYTPFWEKNDVI